MIKPFPLAALLLMSLSACKSGGGELATIEDAEAYAKARGVVLTEKTENSGQVVAPRAFQYKANGEVKCSAFQFASMEAASTWKKTMDGLPLGAETRIQKGTVVFSIWGATDAERQKVIEALK